MEILNDAIKEYFFEFSTIAVPANIDPIIPRLSAVSSSNHSNVKMSLINFKLNTSYDENFNKDIDKCLDYLKERAILLFEALTIKCKIPIIYSAIFINMDEQKNNSAEIIAKQFLKNEHNFNNMSEIGIRLSEEMENKFYKIVNINSNKQIKITKIISENKTEIIFPLISLNEADETKDALLINLEINDRYGFDLNKNYSTTKLNLEKMFDIASKVTKDEIKIFEN